MDEERYKDKDRGKDRGKCENVYHDIKPYPFSFHFLCTFLFFNIIFTWKKYS